MSIFPWDRWSLVFVYCGIHALSIYLAIVLRLSEFVAFLAGVLFRVRLIDLDTEMFTTKVWYEYDMLRTSSISLLLACHVSSASMSGVYNRRHNKFTFNHKVGITIN